MTKVTSQPLILIVDDELELREILATEFDFRGYRTLRRGSGFEAIELLKKHRVDAIVTDLRMQNGTGYDILNYVRNNMANPPPIFVVTGALDLNLPSPLTLGARSVFLKPTGIEVLERAVSAALSPNLGREGRRHRRLHTELVAKLEIASDGFTREAKVLNFSEGGMFVTLTNFFPTVGDKVRFSISVPSFGTARLIGVGIIRWVQSQANPDLPAGFGIEFATLPPVSKDLLAKLLNALGRDLLDDAEERHQGRRD